MNIYFKEPEMKMWLKGLTAKTKTNKKTAWGSPGVIHRGIQRPDYSYDRRPDYNSK